MARLALALLAAALTTTFISASCSATIATYIHVNAHSALVIFRLFAACPARVKEAIARGRSSAYAQPR